MSPFARLARVLNSRPKTVVAAWSVFAAAAFAVATLGIGQGGLFDRVETGPPDVKGSDSYLVAQELRALAPDDVGPRYTAEITGALGTSDLAVTALTRAMEEIASRAGVASVSSPFATLAGPEFTPSGSPNISQGPSPLTAVVGDAYLIVVEYAPFASSDAALNEHQEVARILSDSLIAVTDSVSTPPELRSYSNPLLFDDFTTQLEEDLVTGELIALPLALIVMVLVFGGFLAASAPMLGAMASIAGGLGVLFAFSYPIDLDNSAINVVTVLAIGLSIDYGLLIVSRFREELAKESDSAHHDTRAIALERTMETAGRTVFFSGLTVMLAVGGMLFFSPEIMRGFGGAGLGVVVMAAATALTLVPTLAFLMGHRLAKPSVLSRVPGVRRILRSTADVSRDTGAFSHLAAWVQRRPWWVMAGATALLLVLASPLLNLQVRNSEGELLPVSNERRQVLDTFAERYPSLTAPAMDVLADATPAELETWLAEVSTLDGVTAVVPAVQNGPWATSGIFIDYADGGGADAVALATAIRAVEAPFSVYVGGQAPNQVDFTGAIADGAPLALGIVVLATFILLFLMTGSLLVPVKTLLINFLSLAAAIGVLSWVFTEGNLTGLMNYTPTGGVETYVVVLVLAFGFGLAMDYEVFLLARIKELVDAGVSNNEAVRIGLQRSGRIITSAAAIIVLVFLGFTFGELLVIKEVGFGLAFAVFLDATIVRMLLVPATMTLLGEWNWWSPKPLRKLYARFQITH